MNDIEIKMFKRIVKNEIIATCVKDFFKAKNETYNNLNNLEGVSESYKDLMKHMAEIEIIKCKKDLFDYIEFFNNYIDLMFTFEDIITIYNSIIEGKEFSIEDLIKTIGGDR